MNATNTALTPEQIAELENNPNGLLTPTPTPQPAPQTNPWDDPTSNYDWTQLQGLPTNVTPFEQFDFNSYAQANPGVTQNQGFIGQGQYDPNGENPTPSARDAMYAHYLGRFPDNPNTNLPTAQNNFQPGQYATREYATQDYTDPATGSIRQDLMGGQFSDPNSIPPEVLQERQRLRDEGFLGDWGTGAANAWKAGAYDGSVDAYGKMTAKGLMQNEALNPSFKPGTEFIPEMLKPKADEFLNANNYQVDPNGANANLTTGSTTQAQATDAKDIVPTDASSYEAAMGDLTDEATVRGQMAMLMKEFENGETPPWAAAAMRRAQEGLAANGMSSSSIAGAAVVQAAMEAGLPIAQVDAQTRAQEMFNDQAATNAARQFNAQSEQQNNQFFKELSSTTDRFNSAQKTAVSQFNADQDNAMSKFNAEQANIISRFNSELKNNREQFNMKNRLVIDQSNVQWRRQINTANTATQNAANQINATNLLNISNTAMNNLWQDYRDMADFAFTASENDKTRAHNITLATMQNEAWFSRFNAQQQASFAQNLGGLAQTVIGGVVDDIDFGEWFNSDDGDGSVEENPELYEDDPLSTTDGNRST